MDHRDRILAAAAKRIKHYGYSKTTIAEIAADCGMSPGNIYRFFEAKVDIAEAMARRAQLEQNARMGVIARRKSAPANRRLRELLLTRLREHFAMPEADAKLLEVTEILKKERPLFQQEQAALERVFLAEILRDGLEEGAFRPMDVEFAAEMIHAAAMKFSFPNLAAAPPAPLSRLERELDGVLGLIIAGLRAGGGEPERQYPANEQ